ncbi:hypothetical protein [Tateyamaria sp. ANG-S1]|uniref:DUF6931 family protein n=1 Tax=Tateyamaria sp. ANG-S1 TaxID=1577905 RepID=UPI00068C6860|nr:hypothetical protein [Tateyamaria sp. ANG-S1]
MDDLNSEQTLPPARATRFDRVDDLFREMDKITAFMTERPAPEEGYRAFFQRVRVSQTPEDAVTFICFAVETPEAIQWALDSILDLQPDLSAEDTQLVNWIAAWLDDQSTENRWKTMQMALFAPRKTAIVYLGLAVGWSGGPLAPNDLVSVPAWRTPRAISSAVLRAIGQTHADHRCASLNQMMDRAAGLLRVS